MSAFSSSCLPLFKQKQRRVVIYSPILPPHPWLTLTWPPFSLKLVTFIVKSNERLIQQLLLVLLETFLLFWRLAYKHESFCCFYPPTSSGCCCAAPVFKHSQTGEQAPHNEVPHSSTSCKNRRTPRRACATPLLPPWLSEQTYVTISRWRKYLNADWLR